MTSLNVFDLRIDAGLTGATTGNSANLQWSTASGTATDKAANAATGSVTTNAQTF
jgi:hypothetical protein